MPVDPGVPITPAKPKPQTLPLPIPVAPGHGLLAPPGVSPLTTPHEPPHPVLKQAGIEAGVQGLNQKVDALTQQHQQAFGGKPSPGLVLDVLRSNIPADQYGTLFQIPKNQNDLLAQKALAQHKAENPDDYFVQNPAGVQPDNPLYRWLRTTPPPPGAKPQQFQQLQAKYPMVEAGALPVSADVLGEITNAIQHLNQPGPVPTPSTNVSQEAKYAFGPQTAGPTTEDVRYKQIFARRGVTGLVQAKTELERESGLSFSDGPVFNADDAAKLKNWLHQPAYFKTQLAFQAKNANQSVAQYVKSWDAKWGKSSPVHNGLIGHFLAAMPQQLWGHGGFWGDLFSIPNYLTAGSVNPLNVLLHGLTRTAGLTLDTLGGVVTQAKADAAAAATFVVDVNGLRGHMTYEQALDQARAQLRANPSYARILFGGFLNPDESQLPGWERTLIQATNVVGDLLLLRKPAFTGERVAAGDLGAALKSDHLRAASSWAFHDLKINGRDGIGRAASRLSADPQASGLVARSAKLVQDGKMGENEFTAKVAELYAQGSTEVAGQTVTGSVLPALRTAKLPTPGATGSLWLKGKSAIRDWLDNYDSTVKPVGLDGRAAAMLDTARSAVAHAAPEGAKIGTSQRILSEQVFNFVRKYKLGTNEQANQLESELVRYQGTGNVQGIQSIQERLHSLWDDKYPSQAKPADDPFRAVLSTETPSIFHFPGQAEPKIDNAFESMSSAAKQTNKFLNKVAKLHARVILAGLSPAGVIGGAGIGGVIGGPAGMVAGALVGGPLTLGGFSLFWKHAIGDGLRAYTAGVASLRTAEVQQALAEIGRLAAGDPAIERQLGALIDRLRVGETRWALGRDASSAESFQTGDHLLPPGSPLNPLRSHKRLDAAGGYLRRHLTAPELQGYRDGNLVQVIQRDREARAAWQSQLTRNPDLTAEQHAANVTKEYQDIEAALQAHNLTFDDALNYLRENRGHGADEALGRFIQQNQLDFAVRSGQVESASWLDEVSQKYVGNVIMRPNKFWRSSLGNAVLGKHYAELTKAGWTQENAFHVAADMAENVVKYHMLDFANRLQVEQDLRWVSYFATKHRLYFKWVLSTFARHPGYAAAVADFKQTLDSHGGWTLPFKAAGMNWEIPLERLVWVPGHEYDETSPLGQVALDAVKNGFNLDQVARDLTGGGNAPILTRSDLAVAYGTKLLKIEVGQKPASYLYAASALSKQNHDQVFKALNEYQQEYFRTHGSYASEPHAVKIVLANLLGQEYWRANLPLPVTPLTGTTDSQQKLILAYEKLVDPALRRKFLDDHPGFSDHFGIYENPALKIHNDTLYRRWNKAVDAYRQARATLNQSLHDRPNDQANTIQVEKDRRALSAALERTRSQLLIDDAHQWGIDTHGLVPNGVEVPFGPWGKVANKDPQFDPTHALSALFPKLDQTSLGDVIGPLQRQAQNDLTQLSDPKSALVTAMTPQEVKTTKRELLQKLDLFKAYPTDALGATSATYQSKYVNQYWKRYNQRFFAIGQLPSDQRKQADAAFRAWRDSQDQSVVVDGVTFPSPARMAWATLDPATRQQRLSYLASKPLADLAGYELDMLDVKHPANVSTAISAIDQARAAYQAKNHASVGKAQLLQVAKQIDKQPGYQGFYSFYVTALTQPRVVQFERTSIYQAMPAPVKAKFDQAVGQPALQIVHEIAANKNQSYYGQEWRKAMETQIAPWIDRPENQDLKAYLQPMGANFLNELVSAGGL